MGAEPALPGSLLVLSPKGRSSHMVRCLMNLARRDVSLDHISRHQDYKVTRIYMTGQVSYPGLLTLKPGLCCCAKTVFKLRNSSLPSNSFKGMLLPSYFRYLQKRSSLDRGKEKQKNADVYLFLVPTWLPPNCSSFTSFPLQGLSLCGQFKI